VRMKKHFATHDTFVIEKVYNFTPEVVFAAWADPELKAKWFTEAEEFDFRVGGQEINHGGPPGGPVYTFKAHYQEIIPDHRIVYSYTMDLDETRISVSVATVEFKQIDEGTHLIFTEQGAFLDGHDTAAVREHGTSILLDQLGEQLKNNQELRVSSGVSKIINSPEPISDREIVNTRIFNVPREFMFKAFSDPNHLEKWWGPEGFTNTFHEFDMRPNGIWRFIMHGPNGVDYENKSIFSEIIEPEKIVIHHLGPIHEFLLTITFAEKEGKTELIWQMLHKSVNECEKVRSFCYEANEQNFDRLEAELTKMVNGLQH